MCKNIELNPALKKSGKLFGRFQIYFDKILCNMKENVCNFRAEQIVCARSVKYFKYGNASDAQRTGGAKEASRRLSEPSRGRERIPWLLHFSGGHARPYRHRHQRCVKSVEIINVYLFSLCFFSVFIYIIIK